MRNIILALIGSTVAARHHHHKHQMNTSFVGQQIDLEAMSDSQLVSSLQSTLNSALHAESRDDKAAAIAKTAAIKNIQKALTARILKRLDDG